LLRFTIELYLENGKYVAKATKAASIEDKSLMIQPCFWNRLLKSGIQLGKQSFSRCPVDIYCRQACLRDLGMFVFTITVAH